MQNSECCLLSFSPLLRVLALQTLQIPFKHVLVQVLKGVVGMHANDKNESLRSGNDKISLGHSVDTKQQNDKQKDRVIWPPPPADT